MHGTGHTGEVLASLLSHNPGSHHGLLSSEKQQEQMSGASREGTPVINTVSGRQQGPDVGRGACAVQGDDHPSLGALRDLRGAHQAGTRMVFLFPEPPAGSSQEEVHLTGPGPPRTHEALVQLQGGRGHPARLSWNQRETNASPQALTSSP